MPPRIIMLGEIKPNDRISFSVRDEENNPNSEKTLTITGRVQCVDLEDNSIQLASNHEGFWFYERYMVGPITLIYRPIKQTLLNLEMMRTTPIGSILEIKYDLKGETLTYRQKLSVRQEDKHNFKFWVEDQSDCYYWDNMESVTLIEE